MHSVSTVCPDEVSRCNRVVGYPQKPLHCCSPVKVFSNGVAICLIKEIELFPLWVFWEKYLSIPSYKCANLSVKMPTNASKRHRVDVIDCMRKDHSAHHFMEQLLHKLTVVLAFHLPDFTCAFVYNAEKTEKPSLEGCPHDSQHSLCALPAHMTWRSWLFQINQRICSRAGSRFQVKPRTCAGTPRKWQEEITYG